MFHVLADVLGNLVVESRGVAILDVCTVETIASCSGAVTGRARSIRPLTMLKIAVLAPIAKARVRTATT
jgi:hypothetical protein